jgi:hypothetical protein
MMTPHETEIIAINQCQTCKADLRAHDKFCRQCGVRRFNGYVTSTDLKRLAECETRPLPGGTEEFSSYSGQLIRIVTQSLSARTTTLSSGRGFRRLVCTLITIPIRMLIVMLSPLDALAAARAAAGCLSEQ